MRTLGKSDYFENGFKVALACICKDSLDCVCGFGIRSHSPLKGIYPREGEMDLNLAWSVIQKKKKKIRNKKKQLCTINSKTTNIGEVKTLPGYLEF